MSEALTIELPDHLAAAARAMAGDRPLADAVVNWIAMTVADPPVESLPDDRVLAASQTRMPAHEEQRLSELLAGQREGALTPAERDELDRRMTAHRRGILRQARALKEAVARGLRPPLYDGGP